MASDKKCPCCGRETLEAGSTFDTCPLCGWEDDPLQNDEPDYRGGANHVSLNEAKQAFAEGTALAPLKKAARLRNIERRRAAEKAAAVFAVVKSVTV